MNTTILSIGDLHIKNNNLTEIEELLQQIKNIVIKYKPDISVFLGDILDTHDIIHLQPFLTITRFLDDFCQYSKVYILIGNHDRPNNSVFLTDEHVFNAFKKWNNISIIDTTFQEVINEYTFTFVPYVPVGRFMEALELVDWQKSTIIFAHQELHGCNLNSIISTTGDKWRVSDPLIISGHIHDYHSPQKNVIYIGTPIQHNFGEQDNKGVYIIKLMDNVRRIKKLPIDVIHKQTKKLNVEEFIQYKHIPNPKTKLKLIIEDTKYNLDSVKSTINFSKLRSKGVNVVCKELVQTPLRPLVNTKKYSDLLIDELNRVDSTLIDVFEDVLKVKIE
jgi:DNA repair exonuclease SbcCD nuclease subunit